CDHRPGLRRQRANSSRRAPPIEFNRKQNIRGFRLAVGLPPVIGMTLKIRVLKINSCPLVTARRKGNDTRAARLAKCRPKPRRELKMAQVIRGKLRLISPTIASEGRRH